MKCCVYFEENSTLIICIFGDAFPIQKQIDMNNDLGFPKKLLEIIVTTPTQLKPNLT